MSKLIGVDRLKRDILALHDCYNGFSDTYDKACIIGVIEEQPTIEERKTGRWIWDSLVCTSGGSYGVLRCSECGYYYERVGFWPRRYCPNCGARMEDKDEEEKPVN